MRWGRIRVTIGDASKEEPADDANDPPSARAPGVNAATQMAGLKATMEAIRTQLQRWGAALGAGAAALLTGLGYTTLHKLFPVPAEVGFAVRILVVLSAVVAILGSVLMTSNFFRAQRRIVYAPSCLDRATKKICGIPDVSEATCEASRSMKPRERELVAAVLKEHALEIGFASIGDVELQAIGYSQGRNERVGGRKGVPAEERQAESDRLYEVIALAQRRASLAVLEQRASKAMGKRQAIVMPLVTGVAILGLFVAADYAQGVRDLIDLQTKCKDVVASPGCTAYFGPPKPKPTTTADLSVLDRLQECGKKAPAPSSGPAAEQLWASGIAECAGVPLPVGSSGP